VSGDARERSRALDVARSFIVQAPAGSGKTELLIQRYLALLAHVDLPEQIVAITFTRKAAAEMRRRILAALTAAATDAVPSEPHRAKTHTLAKAALERARLLDWGLDLQPQRLRIDTLDSMNAWLAQRLSVLAGGVAGAEIAENPLGCYRVAIRRTLELLDGDDELGAALETLLRGLDNNARRLEQLLLELLPKRDQWLPYLLTDADESLRRLLETALERLVEESLADVAARLTSSFRAVVVPTLRHVAAHTTDPTMAESVEAWLDPGAALEPKAAMLDAWRGLPELLLTQKGGWRKTVYKKHGFGAAHAQLTAEFKEFLSDHAEDAVLSEAIHALRMLPDAAYGQLDWELLVALRRTLIHLAAELKLVFGERHVVDFVELALGAQQALGSVDEPSELLLALDRRIQHLLVDEFQDTSHTQLRLLTLLTSGWQQDDGRTLFMVGDPMQSIYRFRQADMSLFLKTKMQGLGAISCEPLLLESNFRSAPAVVAWVNHTFAGMFPAEDDIGTGAARFHACEAKRGEQPEQVVRCHALRSDAVEAEINKVVEILSQELVLRPKSSIAVLVRSRGHLKGLQAALRASGLAAHAVELEAPKQRQVIQDVIGLTRAMTHLADRIAWLGVLRAPWCGLTWQDLENLNGGGPERAIWELMQDEAVLATLTADGHERLLHVRSILADAFERRALQPFERWIERAWQKLGGAEILESSENGDLDDPVALEESFAEPHGGSEPPRESGIEIMTIHRAKGLEFDTVILLGLGRRLPADQSKALYWLERTADDGNEDLLLAPMNASEGDTNGLVDFIKSADAVRDRAETMRLLYVATTRARDRLHLVAQLKDDVAKPGARSLLELLWPQFDALFSEPVPSAQTSTVAPASIVPRLKRLRTLSAPVLSDVAVDAVTTRPEFLWAGHAAAQIGTVVHAVLQDIGRGDLSRWSTGMIRERRNQYARELALLGVDEGELETSAARVVEALCAVVEDPQGRWLLERRPISASELPLTIVGRQGLEHLRIDRTFVDDDGLRTHEGGDLEVFLDSEVERYEDQLARYAHAMARIDERPIRVGLYFPLLQAFRSWEVSGMGH
jgi:ATP-dependent exoDNAse (exonuclease V) beta subunit